MLNKIKKVSKVFTNGAIDIATDKAVLGCAALAAVGYGLKHEDAKRGLQSAATTLAIYSVANGVIQVVKNKKNLDGDV